MISALEFSSFPPRLPHQPIFYPVLHEEYAIQIARNWNTRDRASGFAGFVTRFQVDSEFLTHYQIHCVGSRLHEEYWIPAEDLAEFNRHLVGPIEVIAAFRSDDQERRDQD